MQINLKPYPASAGPAAAKRLTSLAERSAAIRARLAEELEDTLREFEAAFERTDRSQSTSDRIADLARANSQKVNR